jgi:hypothetical protein
MRSLILCSGAALGLLACTSEETPTGPSASSHPASAEASGKSAAPLRGGAEHNGKVAVCHRTGNGAFVRIEVAVPAVTAHLAHGDELAGGANEACVPTVISLAAVADGSVRDGSFVLDNSVVQVLHVPSFEDRGIIEFNISNILGPVSEAKLKLSVYASMGPFPFPIGVFAYPGDGALTVDDWDRGTPFTSFEYAGEPTVTLDVTAPLQALASSGATFAGFNFRFSVPSTITQNGPFVAFNSMEYGPAAVLEVTTKKGP